MQLTATCKLVSTVFTMQLILTVSLCAFSTAEAGVSEMSNWFWQTAV